MKFYQVLHDSQTFRVSYKTNVTHGFATLQVFSKPMRNIADFKFSGRMGGDSRPPLCRKP